MKVCFLWGLKLSHQPATREEGAHPTYDAPRRYTTIPGAVFVKSAKASELQSSGGSYSRSPSFYKHPQAIWGCTFFCLRLKTSIIGSMKEIRDNCCGRPFPKATPGCKFNDCCLSETCGCSLGRIKMDADPCKSCCVIPALTVDTVDGITNLANCLVHVISTNTTFYVDDKHRPMITWAGPVEVDDYDIENNPRNLRSQFCLTTIHGIFTEVYFDKTGKGHIVGVEEEYV